MKTPEELYADLGNRGEYAELPHVTLDEVKMIYAEGRCSQRERIEGLEHEAQMWDEHMSQFTDYEGDEAPWQTIEREIKNRESVITKLRLAINEAIAISGTGTPQDWTAAQVGLCKVLEEVKVMLGEKT